MVKRKENTRTKQVRKKSTKTQKQKKKRSHGGMISLPGTSEEYMDRSVSTDVSGPPMFAPYRGMEAKDKRAMQLLRGSTPNTQTSELSVSDSSFGKWMSKSDESIKLRKKKTKKVQQTKSKSRGKSSSLTVRNSPKTQKAKTQKAKTRKRRASSVWQTIVGFFI